MIIANEMLETYRESDRSTILNIRPNILLAEDDKMWCQLIRRSVRCAAEVSTVSTLCDAIYQLDNYSYHAFISDFAFPEVSTKQTLSALRRVSECVPTIVVSGDPKLSSWLLREVFPLRGVMLKENYEADVIVEWMANGFGPLGGSALVS